MKKRIITLAGLMALSCALAVGCGNSTSQTETQSAAQTEAACAGALMVALSGDNYYFGRLVKKPQIGDDIRELETEDIKRSNLLLYITAFLMVVMVSVIRLVLLLQAGF